MTYDFQSAHICITQTNHLGGIRTHDRHITRADVSHVPLDQRASPVARGNQNTMCQQWALQLFKQGEPSRCAWGITKIIWVLHSHQIIIYPQSEINIHVSLIKIPSLANYLQLLHKSILITHVDMIHVSYVYITSIEDKFQIKLQRRRATANNRFVDCRKFQCFKLFSLHVIVYSCLNRCHSYIKCRDGTSLSESIHIHQHDDIM